MYAMKRTPCAQPTNFTAIGISKKYFNGIATQSRSRYEMPSIIAVVVKILRRFMKKETKILRY